MARKRAATPPAASSEETDSRSRSQESEDEETAVVSPPLLIRNPPQKGEDSETTDDDDDEGESYDSVEEANANGGGPRGFAEMCELYPYLAEEVKGLEAEYPGMFKSEFGKIDDRTARAMDAKVGRGWRR